MKSKIIIIGASGHGKVVADIASLQGYEEICFLDDHSSSEYCLEYPVVGTTDEISKYKGSDFFVAIGNPKVRQRITEKLEESGCTFATLIHPTAVISSYTHIGYGTVIMANAVVNPDTRIGKGCIINTGATVDHDNRIEDYVHVSVGSHLAGTVNVGERTWIGIGTVVSNNIRIASDCMIGAGAVVVSDIKETGTYIGVPAKKV